MSTNYSNSDPSPENFWSRAKPVWNDWNQLTRCQLWEAIALACNVDPAIFRPLDLIESTTEGRRRMRIPKSIRELLDSARYAVGSGTLRVARIRNTNLIQSEVELMDFAVWLRTQGHETPKEFPVLLPDLKSVPPHLPLSIPPFQTAQDPSVPAPSSTTLKRAALIRKYEPTWSTIESDFRHASENGLSKAARATDHGYWIEEAAVEWATKNGKFAQRQSPLVPTLASLPRTVHNLDD